MTMEDEIPITRNLDADTIRSLIAVASGCTPDDVDIIVDGKQTEAFAEHELQRLISEGVAPEDAITQAQASGKKGAEKMEIRADARTTVDALQAANRKHAKRIKAADAAANADAIRRALEADNTDAMFDILSSSPAGKDAQ